MKSYLFCCSIKHDWLEILEDHSVCLTHMLADENELPGVKVNIKELDDVLLRDVGDRIKDSGK